jgi:hypothetical protein
MVRVISFASRFLASPFTRPGARRTMRGISPHVHDVLSRFTVGGALSGVRSGILKLVVRFCADTFA